jgi:hypothetical protein
MIPTLFGIIIGAIGLILLTRADVPRVFGFVVLCSMMGGASAIDLPALGGSSIPPVQFALGFLALRCLLPGSGQGPIVREAFSANIALIIFAAYGVVMTYVGPRLFAEQMAIVPMHYTGTALYATFPLHPTSQNITAAVYLVGTLLCAIGAFIACTNEGGGRVLVKMGVVVACLHMFFGVTGALFAGTGYSTVLQFFRNGNYAQLDQHIGEVARMNGIFPEPSGFAAFGMVWFVFMFECWFRDVMPRATGPVAVLMALTLVFSTSSTAYLGLGGYAAIFCVRTLILPSGASSAKLLRIVFGLLAGVVAVALMMLLSPHFAGQLMNIIANMTVNKQGSLSATQRSLWAHQGPEAFGISMGLGIGPGSFRSSSQLMAVLGSMGLVGILSFLIYVMGVLKPLRATTYNVPSSRQNSIGVAAGWSAFCVLITAGFISPTPDPGSDFATMAGASLALRRRGEWAEVQEAADYAPPPAPAPVEPASTASWDAVTLRERDRLFRGRSIGRSGGAGV